MRIAGLVAGWSLLASQAFAGTFIAVPEPASLSLLGIGMGALAIARYRRRK